MDCLAITLTSADLLFFGPTGIPFYKAIFEIQTRKYIWKVVCKTSVIFFSSALVSQSDPVDLLIRVVHVIMW